MATQLLEALIRCDESEAVRAVVITGKGPSFCSGGDITQMMTAAESDGHAGLARNARHVDSGMAQVGKGAC